MESIITAILSITVLIVGVVTTFTATNDSASQLSGSVHDLALVAQDRLQTRLTIQQAQVDPDGAGLTLTVENAGETMITAFNRMDVIIEYFDGSGAKVLTSLPYVADSPMANEWAVWAIQDDYFNPRLLDPGESMLLTLKLSDAIGAGQQGRVTVVAPNGSSAATIFQR